MTDAVLPSPDQAALRAVAARSYWQRVSTRVLRDRPTVVVGMLLLAIVLAVLLAPWVSPHDPVSGSVLRRLKPIGFTANGVTNWLGTDEVGRDLLTRILYGGRLSLLCGTAPVAAALLIGGSLGIAAGYYGGLVNSAIMRSMDVLYAFPSILLAIAICGMLGAGLGNTILALTITFIPPMVRIAETVTTQVRGFDYVDAARLSGAEPALIMRYHILTNVLGPILVYATSLISLAIILSAGLSFLGLGVSPPAAEWGLMLNAMRQAIWVNPSIAALPGVAIFITSMCFNLLSDGLRQAMDVRL